MIRAACSVRSAARDRLTLLAQLLIDLPERVGGRHRAQRVAAEIALEANPEHRRAERREARPRPA